MVSDPVSPFSERKSPIRPMDSSLTLEVSPKAGPYPFKVAFENTWRNSFPSATEIVRGSRLRWVLKAVIFTLWASYPRHWVCI